MKYFILTLSALVVLGGCVSTQEKDSFCDRIYDRISHTESSFTSIDLLSETDRELSKNCMVITNAGSVEWAF